MLANWKPWSEAGRIPILAKPYGKPCLGDCILLGQWLRIVASAQQKNYEIRPLSIVLQPGERHVHSRHGAGRVRDKDVQILQTPSAARVAQGGRIFVALDVSARARPRSTSLDRENFPCPPR
jgi:hypothetical protein